MSRESQRRRSRGSASRWPVSRRSPVSCRRRRRPAEGEDLLFRQAQATQLGDLLLWALEARQDEAVELLREQLGDRSHRGAEEMAAALSGKDADRLDAELPERQIRE